MLCIMDDRCCASEQGDCKLSRTLQENSGLKTKLHFGTYIATKMYANILARKKDLIGLADLPTEMVLSVWSALFFLFL